MSTFRVSSSFYKSLRVGNLSRSVRVRQDTLEVERKKSDPFCNPRVWVKHFRSAWRGPNREIIHTKARSTRVIHIKAKSSDVISLRIVAKYMVIVLRNLHSSWKHFQLVFWHQSLIDNFFFDYLFILCCFKFLKNINFGNKYLTSKIHVKKTSFELYYQVNF